MLALPFGMGNQSVPEPGTFLPRTHTGGHSLTIAWAVTANHGKELAPVRFGEIVTTTLLVPPQVLIRNGQPQLPGLWNRLVDELLT